jgi:hypothetical protein
MTYLNLAPATTALRLRPEEFELIRGSLHHLPSRHIFHFAAEDDVRIDAVCDCSLLRATREQTRTFHAAYRHWRASYWQPLEINRHFAAHFGPPPQWRRLAIWLLRRLLASPHATPGTTKQPVAEPVV